ncbi:clavesin-2-like isoform X1 [Argiope bruennichi]|uniref:Clavesin-2 like protein n=1 Tax=Argiope bruennichi TaxID=94029 RepID=A0A8T0ETK6_ARGBR|nr:clavesin-2-like isoform X1 [Argiope bruennichi]XP_055946310.1 clavesin-2-like isoform X1 [Argiope bruennichi]XP_055946311.1 clavesin-2-like isoform X1 [Argiope bruennichi]XP_055946312.1 clavesin-2-like isoform X1 [Argiope bruennichi]KAF8778768.1 Clavesin-2 like protein [Argiope bruennichi]
MGSTYEEMMKNSEYLPFQLGYLTAEMREKAKRDLNEKEDTRSSFIEELRELILNEKNLKCRTDDEFLLQFLRSRKFNVKKSFACLKKLYNIFGDSYSDVFADHNVSSTREALQSGFGSHLPYRDEEGTAVLLVKTSNWDTNKYDTIGIFNSITAMVMKAIDDPATQVCGVHLLIDVSGMSLQHVRCLTARYLYLVSQGVQNTIPIRYKAIHIFNASVVFRYIWAVLKLFLTDKIRNRIYFHNDNKSLQKLIPKAILPTEYGGDNTEFDPAVWSSRELGMFLPKYLKIINHCSINN